MREKHIAYAASFACLATIFLIFGFYFNLFDVLGYFFALLCICSPFQERACKSQIIMLFCIVMATLIFTGFYFFYSLPFFLLGLAVILGEIINHHLIKMLISFVLYIGALYIYMYLMGEALSINEQIDKFLPYFIFVFGVLSYFIFRKAYLILKERIRRALFS